VFGLAVGPAVGAELGKVVGLSVGNGVGASVLLQQDMNVIPSVCGQHSIPAGRPSSTHRGCCEQSACVVGAADGNRVGLVLGNDDGDAVGDFDGNNVGSKVGTDAAVGSSVAAVGKADGLLDGNGVGAAVLSQQDMNVTPSTMGQHRVPTTWPSCTHRECIEQSAGVVGDLVGNVVGLDVGNVVGLVVGVSVGPGVGYSVGRSVGLGDGTALGDVVGHTDGARDAETSSTLITSSSLATKPEKWVAA